MMKKYQIGQFSKFLGVTPDFLKYYEQFNLVNAETKNNNYRYYRFSDACRVLECLKLRNYGYQLKEIEDILIHNSIEESILLNNTRMEEIKRNIAFEQALIQENERFNEWAEANKIKPHWTIQDMDEHEFLAHSSFDEFYDDSLTALTVNEWTKWMPMVHSARRIIIQNDSFSEVNWGFIVKREFALANQLPLNERTKTIGRQKVLIFPLYDIDARFDKDIILSNVIDLLNLLPNNFTGEIYEEILSYRNMNEEIRKCSILYCILE